MTESNMVTGHVTPTNPPSSPLDTLKALALRNIDMIEYLTDVLGPGTFDIDEEHLEFLDAIRLQQYRALAEHVPVAVDELLGELRHISPEGYRYDDGTLVVEQFESRYGTSTFFTRYDGDRDERLREHREWVGRIERDVNAESTFAEIVDGIDWGRSGPPADL